MRSRNLYALLVIAIVITAGMVVVLRGKGRQATVLDVSNVNSLESAYYIRLNNTIWEDTLNSYTPWHISYSQPNMTARMIANGVLSLNSTIETEPYPQAVNLYRSLNLSLGQDPVLLISLEATQGIHYGIRMSGLDGLGNPFQAWSESSYLQHRNGLGRPENFTINASVEAYDVNGIFAATGSIITSLTFYIEATPGQTGQFSLNVYRIAVVGTNQYSFNPRRQVTGQMDGIFLIVNTTNDLGFTDQNFAQGYVDYYVSGTTNLHYAIYYMHGLTVIGQGFDYSAVSSTYNVATFSSGLVTGYPPLFNGNNTYSIVLSPISGSFLSFQLGGYSVRYLSQAPATTTPVDINASAMLAYYFTFLFVTPVAIIILVSKLFSHENKQAS